MSTDTAKIRSKLAKLDKSLDQLESQLEPLFAQSLPETLLTLDTLQQAKLQVIIPYVVYDLVFVYLKSRGIDPKTHRVVAELERVRQYFDKIKHAEEYDKKRKLEIDKGAASRFIRHAIAQAKNARLVDGNEPSGTATAAGSSSDHERVPVKVTSKMMARAEYEKELEEMGSEEEDNLEVFGEVIGIKEGTADGPSEETRVVRLDKGKGRASGMEQSVDEEIPSSRRKRPRVDRYQNLSAIGSLSRTEGDDKKTRLSTSVRSSVDTSSRADSVSTSEDRGAEKSRKKPRKKAKRKQKCHET